VVGAATGSEFEPRRPHRVCGDAMLFSWIALSKIGVDAYLSIASNDFVQIGRNPGFLKPLGITSERAYRPWLVSPGIETWQEIERKINRDLGGHVRGRSSVLKIREQQSSLEKLTLLYLDSIVPISLPLRLT
jgi:hypothetical protein